MSSEGVNISCDVACESYIMPCIKMDKPLVSYIWASSRQNLFWGFPTK